MMNILEAIQSVQTSAGSLFTREDVLIILRSLDDTGKAPDPSILVTELSKIMRVVNNMTEDFGEASELLSALIHELNDGNM